MKNDKQRCGTRRYHQSEMKNPTTLISGTVTPKWTVPGDRKLQHIIETINDMLKNVSQIVHCEQFFYDNYICARAYCFFDNKLQTLQVYVIEDTKQPSLF